MTKLEELPDSLLLYIFSLLPPETLLGVQCVCSRFFQIATDPSIWRALYFDYFTEYEEEALHTLNWRGWKYVFWKAWLTERNSERGSAALLSIDTADEAPVRFLRFLDQDIVLTATEMGVIKLYSLSLGLCISTVALDEAGFLTCLVTDGDASLALAGSDCQLRLWDARTGALRRTFASRHDDWISCIAFNETIAVSGAADATLKVWDLGTGRCLRTLCGGCAPVQCLAFDGGTSAISGGADGHICVWDLATGQLLQHLGAPFHVASIVAVALSPAGVLAATADASGAVCLWERRPLDMITGHASFLPHSTRRRPSDQRARALGVASAAVAVNDGRTHQQPEPDPQQQASHALPTSEQAASPPTPSSPEWCARPWRTEQLATPQLPRAVAIFTPPSLVADSAAFRCACASVFDTTPLPRTDFAAEGPSLPDPQVPVGARVSGASSLEVLVPFVPLLHARGVAEKADSASGASSPSTLEALFRISIGAGQPLPQAMAEPTAGTGDVPTARTCCEGRPSPPLVVSERPPNCGWAPGDITSIHFFGEQRVVTGHQSNSLCVWAVGGVRPLPALPPMGEAVGVAATSASRELRRQDASEATVQITSPRNGSADTGSNTAELPKPRGGPVLGWRYTAEVAGPVAAVASRRGMLVTVGWSGALSILDFTPPDYTDADASFALSTQGDAESSLHSLSGTLLHGGTIPLITRDPPIPELELTPPVIPLSTIRA